MKMTLKLLVDAYDYRPRLGGVATCGYELCKSLSQNFDIDLRVIAPRSSGDTAFDQQNKFETIRLPLSATAYKAMPALTYHLFRQVLQWKPHATLHMLWFPSGLSAFFNSPMFWMKGVPYFVYAHGVEMLESSSNLKKRLRRQLAFLKWLTFQYSKTNFAVSHFTADLIQRECRVPLSKIRIVGNGVDIERFYPTPKPAELSKTFNTQNRFIFLTVTRLMGYKGIDRAIGALKTVVPQYPQVLYMICGEGPDRQRLEGFVNKYSLQNNVLFVGAVTQEELPKFYNLSDCFVLLSRNDFETPHCEGFGIVFLEAAACEKPVIAGNSGGIPDAVIDGHTGRLVDPNDEQIIARAMVEIIANQELNHRFGIQGRKRVQQSFLWKHIASNIYDEIVKNRIHF